MFGPKKYIVAFLITALIFGTAITVSSALNQKKIENVRSIENRVALDILSSETQFALLEETSCRDIGTVFLSKELGPLGEKLSYAENQSNFNREDVDSLKRSYFLLEIKDYLLMKRLTAKCGIRPTFILYFYSDKDRCRDCEKTGFVLTALQEKYPDIRIYSFDYNFDLEAIRTMIAIYNVGDGLPALIINGSPHYGFRDLEDMEENIPALKKLKVEYDRAKANATTSTSTRIR
jgi:hypothetical protein